MTKLFQFTAVMVLLTSVAAAQQAPAPKPPDQTPQPAQAGDMAITVLVDEPAGAIVPQAGPLVINATFDAAVPPITGAVRNANVVTITTGIGAFPLAHGLTSCTSVTVTGVADPSFNGTFTITGVGRNTFTYAQNGPDATSNGGQVSVTGSTTAAERAVIQQAINEWQAIVQNSGSTTNPYPLSVRFAALGATPACTNVLGITNTFANNTNGNLLFANMAFTTTANTFWEDPLNPPPNNLYDLLSVVRHELGHALGWTGSSVRVTNLLATGAPVATIASGNGAVRNANVVTITTTSPHGLAAGDTITISGVTDGSFNGTFTATAPVLCAATTTFTYAQTGPNAASGGGSVSISVFAAPRLNIPVVTSSGLHTAPAWKPNDLMVPCSAQGVRLPISLYPASSLVARAYDYIVPMQFVDPDSVAPGFGSAVQPWQTFDIACVSSPPGMPLLLANTTHRVLPGFVCASQHVANAARGGATVSQ